MSSRAFATAMFWSGLVLLAAGASAQSRLLLAMAALLAGLGFGLQDRARGGGEGLDNLSFFALSGALWYGFGNLAGYLALDTKWESWFYDWQVDERLDHAQLIATVGLVTPLIAKRALDRLLVGIRLDSLIPAGPLAVPDRQLLWFSFVVILISAVMQLLGDSLKGLGALGGILRFGPNAVIFLLTMRRLTPGNALPRWTGAFVLVVVIVEVLAGLLFGYLRIQMIWPVVALSVPYLIRGKVTARKMVLSLVAFTAFLPVFELQGIVRSKSIVGSERAAALEEGLASDSSVFVAEQEVGPVTSGAATLLARLTTYSQLSHISDIVDREGYYEGETLSYLRYVFIPRFLWPEKPTVSPGRWFAQKIGRGWHLSDGGWSNAVNMTIPGELYLNFGWIGILVGMSLMTLLYRILWDCTRFRREPSNPIGQVFAWLALTQAIFSGSHAGALASLAIWIVLLHIGTWSLHIFLGRGGGLARTNRATARGAAG